MPPLLLHLPVRYRFISHVMAVAIVRRKSQKDARDFLRIHVDPGTVVVPRRVPTSFVWSVPESAIIEDIGSDVRDIVHIGPRYRDHGGRPVKHMCRGADIDPDTEVHLCAAGRRYGDRRETKNCEHDDCYPDLHAHLLD